MDWEAAPDIQKQVTCLIHDLSFSHLRPERVFCFRSFGSKSRAIARIWSLPRIWQQALNAQPAYCLEVIAHKFDKLNREGRSKVLIHELLHIPQNFSGSLLSHRTQKGERYNKKVERLFNQLIRKF